MIADEYTREAGVRNLERQIGTVCRKIARDAAEGKLDGKAVISADRARELLGPRKFFAEQACRTKDPGSPPASRGPWSAARCCSSRRPRWMARGTSRITGQLGDVMKESAQAALSWVRGHQKSSPLTSPTTGSQSTTSTSTPLGAVPKDGPSAGVAIDRARLAREQPARVQRRRDDRRDPLTGQVLLIGGSRRSRSPPSGPGSSGSSSRSETRAS